jgi:hypothetical protein
LPVWIVVESIFLSTWGTTWGKSLLKTQVRDNKGKKLTFYNALKRSFLVWFKGLGMGIPPIFIITLLVSYNELNKKGITSWDGAGNLIVTHKKMDIGYLIAAVIDKFIH